MEGEKRIYGKVSDIDGHSVQKLFDERARNQSGGYVSVLLGDQNPDYAHFWDEFEKKTILPKLELSKKNSFIDVGCGIGRWGEAVIPLCKYYAGCDFSSEMIAKAKKRISFGDSEYTFINCSFQQVHDIARRKIV